MPMPAAPLVDGAPRVTSNLVSNVLAARVGVNDGAGLRVERDGPPGGGPSAGEL
jgi:hypothetical protein